MQDGLISQSISSFLYSIRKIYNIVHLICTKNKVSTDIIVKNFMKVRNIGKLSDHLKNTFDFKNCTHSFNYSFIQQILIEYQFC